MEAVKFTRTVMGGPASGDPADVVMPFGRHRGAALGRIDSGYLRWLAADCNAASADLKAAAQAVIARRAAAFGASQPTFPPTEDRDACGQLREELSQTRQQVIDLRQQLEEARRRPPPTGSEAARRVLKQWYGAMSRRFHPDLGGSPEKQAVVNQCYEDLLSRMEDSGCFR